MGNALILPPARLMFGVMVARGRHILIRVGGPGAPVTRTAHTATEALATISEILSAGSWCDSVIDAATGKDLSHSELEDRAA